MPSFLQNMTKILEENGGQYMVGTGVGIFFFVRDLHLPNYSIIGYSLE